MIDTEISYNIKALYSALLTRTIYEYKAISLAKTLYDAEMRRAIVTVVAFLFDPNYRIKLPNIYGEPANLLDVLDIVFGPGHRDHDEIVESIKQTWIDYWSQKMKTMTLPAYMIVAGKPIQVAPRATFDIAYECNKGQVDTIYYNPENSIESLLKHLSQYVEEVLVDETGLDYHTIMGMFLASNLSRRDKNNDNP